MRRLLQRIRIDRQAPIDCRALANLETSQASLLLGLIEAVEAKDPCTIGHSARVMRYASRIGELLGLDGHYLDTLELGALIHDIGKIGVPARILNKPARLAP